MRYVLADLHALSLTPARPLLPYTMNLRELGRSEGIRYALSVVKARRILNRPPAYTAALDEVEIFLEAALERLAEGKSMHAEDEVQ